MSRGEVLVSEGEASESGEDIVNSLPSWMPRTTSSGNFKLLDAVGRTFDELKDQIGDADDATNVQTAQTVEQLREISRLVNLPPKSGESLEKYRLRVIGEFQNTTNEADLPSIIDNTSLLLDINKRNIEYIQGTENGSFILKVPTNSINSVELKQSEFSEIIQNQTAAGYRVDVQLSGTFTFISSNKYNNSNHDPSKGYDGLDVDGNKKDNGGTYAGVLN